MQVMDAAWIQGKMVKSQASNYESLNNGYIQDSKHFHFTNNIYVYFPE